MADFQQTVTEAIEKLRAIFKPIIRIGLDITSDTIVIVEIRRVKNDLVLHQVVLGNTPWNSVQEGEVTDPTALADTLQALLVDNDIESRRAVCGVAGQSTIVRPVRFPVMPDSELREVVNYEAERYIPFALEDVNLTFDKAGEIEEDGTQKYEVILVAAQKTLVNSLIETAKIAEMQLDALDVASFAILRTIADTDQCRDDMTIALVHVQGWTTDISILVSGVPRFTRSIPIGFAYLLDLLINSMGVDEDTARQLLDEVDVDPQGGFDMTPEAEQAAESIRPALGELTGEISRSLDFYLAQGADPIDRVILSGRGGNIRGIDRYLASRVAMPVEPINPFHHIVFDEAEFPRDVLLAQGPTLAAAIGLAMRGALGE
ncbi:MAG: type IV pilus assembly protein PilM [Candidatus Sericytochromatia bacterium]|nr:type IV pilus assembly protein PilM [Candidatus Sericytochromatia bacterium]